MPWRGRPSPVLVQASIGAAALAVPTYDLLTDAAAGKSVTFAVLENAPLFALATLLVASSVWLARSGWQRRYRWRVVAWTATGLAAVTVVFAVVVGIQLVVQSELKPFVIAADAVLVGTVLAAVAGAFAVSRRRVDEGQFRALFENVPIPVVSVRYDDGTAYVHAVNPAFEDLFGYDREAIVGEQLGEYLLPQDAQFEPLEPPTDQAPPQPEAVSTRDVYRFETERGQREFVRLTVPVEDNPEQDGYGIYIDVSEQRRRRERLHVLGRMLRHDLRNHVNVIKGAGETLSERYDDDLVETLQRSADRLMTQSERTRFAERLVDGDVETETTRLVDVVDDVVDRVEDADVTTDVPGSAFVEAAPTFTLALEEIVQNAAQHGCKYGERATVTVSANRSPQGEYWNVRVADNGPGIDPREYEVVTGEREHSQVEHPTGLGLWIAHWVLQGSGGKLSFASNSPSGTVVTLRVPSAHPATPDANGVGPDGDADRAADA